MRRRLRGGVAYLAAASVGASLLGPVLSARASASDARASSGGAPPSPTLAVSRNAGSTTFATVPVAGYWELFAQRAGGHVVLATPPGVEDSGGLVIATTVRSLLPVLVAGFRPTDYLRFSPLESSTDVGRSWSAGLLASGLVNGPDTLAATPNGTLAAVTLPHHGTLVTSAHGLSHWQKVTDADALGRLRALAACAPYALGGVALAATTTVVALGCTAPGVVGLARTDRSGWALTGPAVPHRWRRARVGVLRLDATGNTLTSVLSARLGTTSALLAARSVDGGRHWSLSAPLTLPAGSKLLSEGPTGATGAYVLSGSGPRARTLAVTAGPGARWTTLPAPPARTAAVAFCPAASVCTAGAVSAFAVDGEQVTVSALAGRPRRWVRETAIDVPVTPSGAS